MSRIGKKPISIPAGVTVTQNDGSVNVSGQKGAIDVSVPAGVRIALDNSAVTVTSDDDDTYDNLIGLVRSLLQNAVNGVSNGWTKQLELVGVGYRAQTNGSELTVHVGYSHPVVIKSRPGISFAVAENKITVSGHDKYVVGEVAAAIRRIKPPEPYKGKGIRYNGEVIRKKVGKAGKAVGGAAGK